MKKISKWKTVWQPILLLGLMLFNWFSAAFKYLSKRSKRIFAMMLAVFTLIPNVQALALNVGDRTTIERKWVDVYYDFNYNGHYYGQFSILTAKATGEPVYCLEPHKSVDLSANANAVNFIDTPLWRNLSRNQRDIITQASIYGYRNYTYGYSVEQAQTATNMIMWDVILGQRTGYGHGTCSWVTSCPSAIENCYNKILDAMSTHTNRPSINNTTVTLKGTGESNAVTLTDTNGVLSNFNIISSNSNIKFSQSGNKLKIWCTAVGNYSGAINMVKKNTDISSSLALVGANQTVLYGSISDPVPARINVNVQSLKCSVSVAKEDSETNAILDGAGFKVQQWSYKQNKYVDLKNLAATEYNGSRRYTASGLEYTDDNGGWFRIAETGAPNGYELKPAFVPGGSYTSTAPGEFRLTEDMNGKTFSFTVKDPPQKGVVEVIKDAEDNFKEGHKFKLTGTSTIGRTVSMTDATDKNGRVRFEDVYVGSGYTLEEIETGIQYVVPPSQSVSVKWNEVTQMHFNNLLKKADIHIKKDSEDHILKGFTFAVLASDGNTYTAITDENGDAWIKNVPVYNSDGTKIEYAVREANVPIRYVTPDGQTVTLEADKTAEVLIYNALKKADMHIKKDSEDHILKDFTFSVSASDGNTYTAVTDENGDAYVRDVPVYDSHNNKIEYAVQETNVPIRYVTPDGQTVTLEPDTVKDVPFQNVLKKFSVELRKADREKGTPQGDASLAGAVYGIFDGEKLIDTYKTDADGFFRTAYYVCGENWTMREIEPSPGYLLDETVYKIGAEAKLYTEEHNTIPLSVTEQVIKGSIALIKHTDNGGTQIERPEVGAEFEIFLKSAGSYKTADAEERDVLVCDEYGFAESKLLPYGVYTVHQTKSWDGRDFMPDFDVYIAEDGQIYRYLINNSYFEGYLKVVKVAADSRKPILYAGAGFQLYDPSGKQITMQVTYPTPVVIDTFYTNAGGYLVTPQKLEYGKGYSLVEVQAPYGCVLDSTPIYFDITEENAEFEDALAVVTVERPNELQMGTIEISKTGSVFSSVQITEDNRYVPVFSDKALAGTVFNIYAAEDIITPDGKTRLKKGKLADTVVTDENGRAVSKPLYLGRYFVREKKAAFSFVLNKTQYPIELAYAGQEVNITNASLAVHNERQRVSLSLKKVLEADKLFNLGEIRSVSFGIYANENIAAADGSVIPKNSLITSASCDEHGDIQFDCDLPIGFKWYAKETETDGHYILSDTKYEFETEYKGADTESYSIEINSGRPIENLLKRGSILGFKTDRETGNPIKNALFGLFRESETDFTKENALLTDKTNRKGIFSFEDIPKGNYLIKELEPAKGYLPNGEIYAVTVSDNEEIVELSVVNDRIPEIRTSASINTEKDAFNTGVVAIEDTVAYSHLIPGKEYRVHGLLMNKATGEPFTVNDEQITAEAVFVPEEPNGTVTVSFAFDAGSITENTDLVVFEELYRNDIQLAVHQDLEDEGQTVTVYTPAIRTTATANDEKSVFAAEAFTIEDTVSYTDLIPGKEYRLLGTVMNKTTGKPFEVDGEIVQSECIFTPEEADGAATVAFDFDADSITENTDLVVFEQLFCEDTEIANHRDLEDEGQTVSVFAPTISTSATVNGEKEITTTESITVTDTVTYKNLIPGKEYFILGVLMDKKTGKPFTIDGKEIRAELKFTPKEPNCQLEIPFTFNGSSITEETEIVVFETLFYDGTVIAEHADIHDKGQTVKINPLPEVPETGNANAKFNTLILTGTALSGVALLFFLYFYRRRKKCSEKD